MVKGGSSLDPYSKHANEYTYTLGKDGTLIEELKGQGINSAAGPNRQNDYMANNRQQYANSEMMNRDGN